MSQNVPIFSVSQPYRPIGRHLLVVDNLGPEEEVAEYWRDAYSRAYVVPKNARIPEVSVTPEQVQVPGLRIGTNLIIKAEDIKRCSYDLRTRRIERGVDSISRQMDIEIFKIINASCLMDHGVTASGTLLPQHLNMAMGMIEEHDLEIGNIIMHPSRWKDVRSWHFDSSLRNTEEWLTIHTRQRREETGIHGQFFEVAIRVSTMIPKNACYVLAEKEYVGVLPVYADVSHSEAVREDGTEEAPTEWTVGCAVLNDYAIARVSIT